MRVKLMGVFWALLCGASAFSMESEKVSNTAKINDALTRSLLGLRLQCLEVLKKDLLHDASVQLDSPKNVDTERAGKTLPYISFLSFGGILQKPDYWEMTICILLHDVEYADSLLCIESPVSEEKPVVTVSDDHTQIKYERNLKKHYKVNAKGTMRIPKKLLWRYAAWLPSPIYG